MILDRPAQQSFAKAAKLYARCTVYIYNRWSSGHYEALERSILCSPAMF